MNFRKNAPLGLRLLGARWDWALVLLLTPIALILTSLIIHGAIDPFDEGSQYLSYALFKAGKRPYIDFYPLFPPIWIYSNIVIEKIFGEYLLVQRLWFVLQATLVVWTSYALCKKVYSRRLVAIIVMILLIFFGFHPFWTPRWSGARLAVYIAVLLMYIRHMEGGEAGAYLRVFTLGLFTGLANLYALDVGIHISAVSAAMVVITFLGTKRTGIRAAGLKFFTALAGLMLPLILWAVYLAYHGSLYMYISTYYYVFMFQLMSLSVQILSEGNMNFSNLRFIMLFIFLVLLAGGLLYTVIYKGFVKKELTGEWRVLIMAMLLSSAASVSTLRAVTGPQYQMFALIPMLLWGGFTADRLTSLLSKRPGHEIKRPASALISIITLTVLALISYFMTTTETLTKIFATRTNLIMARLLYQKDERLNLAFSTVPQLAYNIDNHFDSIIQYLHSHTRPDEAVLNFPMYGEVIPALAGRHSATSYPAPILLMGSPGRQLDYIDEIEKEKPRYAVFFPMAKYGDRRDIAPYYRPVYIYMFNHYRPVKDFPQGRDQQIWIRRDTAGSK